DFIQSFLADTTTVIVLVCDQPLLTADHLNNLIDKYRNTGAAVVASQYSGSLAVPVLFDSSLFSEIRGIDDQHGAQQIIEKHWTAAHPVEVPGGDLDIDPPDDYQRYQQSIRPQVEVGPT